MIKELFFAKLRRKGTIFFLYIKATIVFFNLAGLRKRFFASTSRCKYRNNARRDRHSTCQNPFPWRRLLHSFTRRPSPFTLFPCKSANLPKAEARPPFTLYARPPRVGRRLQQRKLRPCGIFGKCRHPIIRERDMHRSAHADLT